MREEKRLQKIQKKSRYFLLFLWKNQVQTRLKARAYPRAKT
jgi:hypothetical protein